MTWASPRASCFRCVGEPQTGTAALAVVILEMFSYTRSMGIYNCREVAGTRVLSVHACGRAWDDGIPTQSNGQADTSLGYPIIHALFEHGEELGIVAIIYDRVTYDAKTPTGRSYGGVHPHHDHAHIEQLEEVAQTLTVTKARLILQGTGGREVPKLPVEYGMKNEDVREAQILLNDVYSAGLTPDAIYGNGTAAAVKNLLLGFTSEDSSTSETGRQTAEGKRINAAMWRGLNDARTLQLSSSDAIDLSNYYTKSQSNSRYPLKKDFTAHVADVRSDTPHS